MRAAYADNKVLGRIVEKPGEHPEFAVRDGLVYMAKGNQLCVPDATIGQRRLAERLIDAAHTTLGHMGDVRTMDYLRRWYWW
ncbi:hypothetical protein BDV93DRAFT_410632, partial [Ceratobasidium sp. AG-I]